MTNQQNWRVTGPVTYREGDGIHMEIPAGACQVAVTPYDATISWADGKTRGSAAVSLGQFIQWRAVGWLRAD